MIVLGLVERDGRALLVRESYGLQLWGLPGGRAEPGESMVDAVRREVYEETGLEAELVGLIGLRERSDQLCLVFHLHAVPGQAKTNDPAEIIDLAWIDGPALAPGAYDIDDFSRRVLEAWFGGSCLTLPVTPWLGRDGRKASLIL